MNPQRMSDADMIESVMLKVKAPMSRKRVFEGVKAAFGHDLIHSMPERKNLDDVTAIMKNDARFTYSGTGGGVVWRLK